MTRRRGGEKKDIKSSTIVLVAAGRAPNVEDIGLKEAGVQLTERGFIKINERMETTRQGRSTRSATWPARRCSRTRANAREWSLAEMLAGKSTHGMDYGNIPNATYCHPEVASIGLTEAQCKEKKLDYKVGKFPFSANGRARTVGRDRGLREDHSRREVRRDPRRAHRRRARHGADPRARGCPRKRVHGRGGRTRRSTRTRRCAEAIAEAALDSHGAR